MTDKQDALTASPRVLAQLNKLAERLVDLSPKMFSAYGATVLLVPFGEDGAVHVSAEDEGGMFAPADDEGCDFAFGFDVVLSDGSTTSTSDSDYRDLEDIEGAEARIRGLFAQMPELVAEQREDDEREETRDDEPAIALGQGDLDKLEMLSGLLDDVNPAIRNDRGYGMLDIKFDDESRVRVTLSTFGYHVVYSLDHQYGQASDISMTSTEPHEVAGAVRATLRDMPQLKDKLRREYDLRNI